VSDQGAPHPDEAVEWDPYRAPGYFEQRPALATNLDPWQRLEASQTLRKFRGCCTTLGVVLCLVGTLSFGAAAFTVATVATQPGMPPAAYAVAAFFVATVAAYFIFGIGTLCRQVWAAGGAAALGGLEIAVDLLFGNLNVVSALICVAVIVLGLTIVSFARRLRAAGVPLRTKLQGGMIVD
jgi:hypothetical protein